MDTELVDRSRRPVGLTEAGKLYWDLCRDVLRRKEEFDTALGKHRAEVEGTVRVASIYSVGLSEMSRLEREFADRYPNAELRVEYLRPERVYASVENDVADLGIVSYPEPTRHITVIDWIREQMVAEVSPAHPLARKSSLQPEDLEGVEFIGFDADLPIRRELDRFLRERGVRVQLTKHFDNLQTIKEAVAVGAGVSILPARIMQQEVEQGRLVGIPIDAPELFRPLGIIHRRSKRLNRAAQSFLELLRQSGVA
jgi:DNA-binding transcriptional LysR family regulator